MRFPAPVRSIATLLMAVGVATCSDTPIAAVKAGTAPSARMALGHVAMTPVFSKTAQYVAQHIVDFPTLRYDSVRVLIRGNPDTSVIVKDTTVFFDRNSKELTLDLNVPVANDGQRFNAAMDYRGPDGVIFRGVAIVQSHRPDQPAPEQQTITINFVGPGSKIARIAVNPKTVSLLGTQSAALTVTAVDSSGASVAVPFISWSSSNASVASVTGSGVVQGQSRRGTVSIIATTPTGISDAASANVILPAAGISVVGGAGQSGKAGTALGSPATVQVSAADGIGVPGVGVVFSAPAGGSVSPTTATTDASGRASTTMRLGSAVGPQGFAATAAGFSTSISATATAGDPAAIAIVSGSGQTDSVKATLAPLSVKVTDALNNPVSGTIVTWGRSGGGSLGAATSTTNADGIATNSYTLGGTIGTESATASAGAASVTFSFTVTGGSPAAIAAVSGGGQSARVLEVLPNPMVVKVTDASGNPVKNASVTWSAVNGSIETTTPSDLGGQASATMKLGTAVGNASAIARIANGQSVTFAATATPGVVTGISFSNQPGNGTAGQPLGVIRLTLRDASNNIATTGSNAITISLGNNPTGATLQGTLTRNPVAGVVTFDDLRLDRAGNGYTLSAVSTGLPTITSTAFNIAPGNVSGLSVSAGNGQSATVNTNVSAAPSVKVTDGSNNPIPGISVTFTPATGSGTIVPANGVVTTNALGEATLTSWTLGTTAGPQSLVVTSTGLQPVTISATATAGNAFKLVVKNKGLMQGALTSGAVLTPQPIIQVVDQFGNSVPAGQMNVTASLTAASGLTLGGTTNIPLGVTSGQGTFANLAISGSGSTKLAFTEGSGLIKPDTSGTISVSSAGPTVIAFSPPSSTPFSTKAGTPLSAPPTIVVRTAAGVGVSGVPVHIALTFGGVTTGVKDTVSGANGELALPSAVVAPTTAGSYIVTATSSAIPLASASVTINVTPGEPTKLAFVPAIPSIVTVSQPFSATVQVQDTYGNLVDSDTTSVSLGTTGSSYAGTGLGTTSHGSITFSISFTSIGTNSLGAFASHLTPAPYQALTIAPGGATQLKFGPLFNQAVGGTWSVQVSVADAGNNTISTATGSVTLSLTGGDATATLTGANGLTAPLVNGTATFLNLSVDKVANAYAYVATMSPTIGSVPAKTSTVFSVVNVAIPNNLDLSTGPAGGNSLVSPQVTATDANNAAIGNVAYQFLIVSPNDAKVAGGAATSGILTSTGQKTETWKLSATPGPNVMRITAGGKVFNVTVTGAGTATQIAASGSPTFSDTAGKSLTTFPAVIVKDASNVPVAGASVVFTVGTGSGTVDGTSTSQTRTTNALGVATMSGWALPTAVGVYTTTATPASGSLTGSPVTFTATVSPDAAAKLAIKTQPSSAGTIGVALSTQPVIKVTDGFGNAVTQSGIIVTAAPDPSSVSLSGGTTATTTSAGEATFSGLTLNTVGGATLIFSAPGLTSIPSDPVTIAAGTTADHLSFSATATADSVAVGGTKSLTVLVKDVSNTTVAASGTVTLTLSSGTFAATGTTTQTATLSGGSATFANVAATSANASVVPYTISASTTAISTAGVAMTSITRTLRVFNVALQSGVDGQTAGAGTAVTVAPSAKITDGTGAAVAGIPVAFHVVSPSDARIVTTGTTTLAADTTVSSDASGVAMTTGWILSGTAGANSMTATSLGKTIAISATGTAASVIGATTTEFVQRLGSTTTQTISAKASDVSSRAVGNVPVQFSVIDGSCSVSPSTVVATSVAGTATATVTLPGTSGSCMIRATSPSLSLPPITYTTVDAPTSATKVWMGSVDDDWTQASNWRTLPTSAGGAPNSNDYVFVPKNAYLRPKLGANTTIGGFATEAGSVFDMSSSGYSLTVRGNVDVAGGFTNVGELILDAAGPATMRLASDPGLTRIGSTTACQNGTTEYSLSGNVNTASQFVMQCPVTVAGRALVVGNVVTQGPLGVLIMTNAADSVRSLGDISFNGGSEFDKLTAGVLEASTYFTQSATNSATSFIASGTHRTKFRGSGTAQQVSFASPSTSKFNNVELLSTASAKLMTSAQAGGTLTVNNATISSNGLTEAFTVSGTVSAGSAADLGRLAKLVSTGTAFPSYANATAGKGPQVTEISNSVTLAANTTVPGGLLVSGTLNVNGKTLTVLDSLTISGTIVANSGTLDVAGRFQETGSASAFQPATGFLTRLSGSSGQSVSFLHPGTSSSYFRDLTITNTSSSGVTFSTSGFVKGALTVGANAVLQSSGGNSITAEGTVIGNSGSKMSGVSELIIAGSSFPTFNGTAGSNSPAKTSIAYTGGFLQMTTDATLSGALSIPGYLEVAGHKLSVGGDLTVQSSGILKVASRADSIVVQGNATFSGDQSSTPFSAGAFDFRGNVTASGTQAFYVSSFTENTARFKGSSTQTVNVPQASTNTFGNIVVSNSSAVGARFTSNAVVKGLFTLDPNGVSTIDATLALSGAQPAIALHGGSKLIVNSNVSINLGGTCEAHDNSTFGGGATASISGSGIFTDFSAVLGAFGVGCARVNLP